MVAETILTPNDFIVPLFIDEGKGQQHEIPSMPGYYRRSIDGTDQYEGVEQLVFADNTRAYLLGAGSAKAKRRTLK